VLGFHLFPFRTEKLSPITPMVLQLCGRVGRRRFYKSLIIYLVGDFCVKEVPADCADSRRLRKDRKICTRRRKDAKIEVGEPISSSS
jgi:hypothetical protein